MGLVNGQLNGPCLIDSEIVTGSIEVGGAVFPPPLLLSWDDVKLTTLSCGLVLLFFFFFSLVFCMTR